jgi:uncharacterized protein YndB with AHSA1/START domain
MTTTTSTRTTQVFRVYIKASAEKVWEAITSPEWNARYGYPGHSEYDLRPGGAFRALMPAEMVAEHGVPELACDGEVVEVDAPHRLVQTYRFNFAPDQTAEGFHEVTWDLHEEHGGITRLTVTHDVTDAPIAAAMIEGSANLGEGGGGWAWILSDLKTLLETGGALEG